MVMQIHGRHFIDRDGRVVHLRGANVSGCSKVFVSSRFCPHWLPPFPWFHSIYADIWVGEADHLPIR